MTTIIRHLHTYAVLAQRSGNAAWTVDAARLILAELPEDPFRYAHQAVFESDRLMTKPAVPAITERAR